LADAPLINAEILFRQSGPAHCLVAADVKLKAAFWREVLAFLRRPQGRLWGHELT
jgi:hypothetical protein